MVSTPARRIPSEADELERTPPFGTSAPVTLSLIGVCAGLCVLEYVWKSRAAHATVLWHMGANNGVALCRGEIERLLASVFLHDDWMHLLVNAYMLWLFGKSLERLIGPRRFLILFVACAVGGALLSVAAQPRVMSIGASGAIWGLMAAAIGIRLWPRGLLPPTSWRRRAMGWVLGVCLSVGVSFLPGVDTWAHLGGGLVGLALSLSVLPRGLIPLVARPFPAAAEPGPRPWLSAVTLVVALATVASVATAMLRGRPWQLTRKSPAALLTDAPRARCPEGCADQGKRRDQHGEVPALRDQRRTRARQHRGINQIAEQRRAREAPEGHA